MLVFPSLSLQLEEREKMRGGKMNKYKPFLLFSLTFYLSIVC